ncbi:MAG TPA: SDR family oxidoreductase, partial [Candidatus Limnocylindrales bacterium]|nr:SDR family oxidoreductase [Candidatus Limnocylindrales bacterium]
MTGLDSTGEHGTDMRILVTGSEGYIGTILTPFLLARGHDVVGLDTGFHRVGWLYNGVDRAAEWINKDIRNVTEDDLRGFDAVVHLAELSNDPVGQLNPDITFQINHQGSVRLATLARAAGVERFIYMSSCSVYGAAGDEFSTETSPLQPQTAYAQCKVLVERDVRPMANDVFSPTFLRNATAFGASPRQRFDLVVNDLAGHAWTEGVIRMDSDGRPWRPLVHIL